MTFKNNFYTANKNNRKNNSKIPVPFLWMFLKFYGNLSIQLQPYSLFGRKNLPNFAWNQLLFGLTLYKFISVNLEKDEDDAERRVPTLAQALLNKPLFAIIFNLSQRGDFQIFYLFNALYFLVINYRGRSSQSKSANSLSSKSETSLVQCLSSFSRSPSYQLSSSSSFSPSSSSPLFTTSSSFLPTTTRSTRSPKYQPNIFSYPPKPSFSSPFSWDRWGPSVRAFAAVIAFHQLLFTLTLLQMIIGLSEAQCWTELAVRYSLTFTVNVISNMPFILVFYYKYATLRALDGLLHQVQSFRARHSCLEVLFQEAETELARLARLNHTLNRLVSLPLIISMLPLVFELIVVLSSLLFESLSWDNAFLLQLPLHIAILCLIEGAASRRLNRLEKLLKRRADSSGLYRFQNGSEAKVNRGFYSCCAAARREEQLNALKCPMLLVAIYRRYFGLRIFNLLTVNWSFAFGLTLFILEYIILVTQTTSSA